MTTDQFTIPIFKDTVIKSCFMKFKYILLLTFLGNFLFAQKKERPNVLFIISDDLTATAVSSYENNECQTPNIDKLASEVTLYTGAYSQQPVCGPSRSDRNAGYE